MSNNCTNLIFSKSYYFLNKEIPNFTHKIKYILKKIIHLSRGGFLSVLPQILRISS